MGGYPCLLAYLLGLIKVHFPMFPSGRRDSARWTVGGMQSMKHTNDFVALQWFADACWSIVYVHDENGTRIDGVLDVLKFYIKMGHRVRVHFDVRCFFICYNVCYYTCKTACNNIALVVVTITTIADCIWLHHKRKVFSAVSYRRPSKVPERI